MEPRGAEAKGPAERGEPPQESSRDAPKPPPQRAHAVRFASNVDEIGPPIEDKPRNDSSATPEQLQALTECLNGTHLQEQRAQNYAFQPMSLPPSRIPSNETTPSATPQHSHSPMAPRSPHFGPSSSGLTPPLTPAGTSAEQAHQRTLRHGGSDGGFPSYEVTPQDSSQDSRPVSRLGLPHRPASSDNLSQRTTAVDDRGASRSHRRGMFGPDKGGQSLPVSRESSPSRNAASQFYTRPFTPQGDANDPYAASKRPAQSKNTGTIDQRFVFSRKNKQSPTSSTTSLRSDKSDKRHSGFLGGRNKSGDLPSSGTNSSAHHHHHQSSMSDLRRFFKVGGSHKPKKLPHSPAGPASGAGSRPSHLPFADDHGLSSKYGKIGRVLGSGAGGSVKLMKRSEDNTVFAVKEFRPRHSYETEKEYTKKLTAEFCFGSALHHGNIIETLDIVQEKGKWYEVMEYAPYDLFAIVMTGRMSKAEINCCFLQILSGVTYLHGSGLAHRDLKLDNVVVSEHGIMKIIDFGSAHVFKYPFESEIVLASGIVGSDPYLAPEVYDERKYDPQAVDIWSLAIIFCCMSLRRFPWKIPRMTDNSYRLFASSPTPGHDPKQLILPSRLTNNSTETSSQDVTSYESPKSPRQSKPELSTTTQTDNKDPDRKEVIKGPWRLLRLLPRESRHIIGRMLTIDPRKRADMAEILDEPWVSDTVICRQVGPGMIEKAEDHEHVLEPPAPAPSK
ncbi:kinase-like domain-containing protein [Xylaria bambusicola]|uniref:kinase-like domain-containing protein n=1 Tax=Xylaria bambusicola TaxID=326684 RepID=UPI002007E28A|nr:kinase-like domain-containing protein [Xylaria bambusicola]KAI0525749.1 kinase-like domain-containing protein [Xylaria bambusicola]